MRKQTSTFDQMHGQKPDPEKSKELKEKLSSIVPKVLKAVEDRERVAARILLREMEGVKRRKRELPAVTTSSEDAHKRP